MKKIFCDWCDKEIMEGERTYRVARATIQRFRPIGRSSVDAEGEVCSPTCLRDLTDLWVRKDAKDKQSG